MYKIDLALIIYNDWCAIKPNWTKPNQVTTPFQIEPGKNGNEGVLYIPQSANTEVSASGCFVSYPGNSLRFILPPTEIQFVFSIASVD